MNWDFNSQEEKRPVKSEEVNDFEFAKCITLLSEEIMQTRASRANGVLVRVGSSCEWGPRVRRLGRRLERQFIAHNHAENITIITRYVLENVAELKHLGFWVCITTKYVKTRKGMAQSALNQLSKIWKYVLPHNTKKRLPVATVVSVLRSDTSRGQRQNNYIVATQEYCGLLPTGTNTKISWELLRMQLRNDIKYHTVTTSTNHTLYPSTLLSGCVGAEHG